MTQQKQQAYLALQNVLGSIPATRQQHEQFMAALNVLASDDAPNTPVNDALKILQGDKQAETTV